MEEFVSRVFTGGKVTIPSQLRELFGIEDGDYVRLALVEVLKKKYSTPNLNELYSDVFLLLNQFYFNNYRACYISLRCILEDLYRHIYYLDHPQEFQYLVNNAEGAPEVSPRFLREYLEKVTQLAPLKNYDATFEKINASDAGNEANKNNIFHLNNELYGRTSVFVHGSDPDLMSGFKSNADLVFNQEISDNAVDLEKRSNKSGILKKMKCFT